MKNLLILPLAAVLLIFGCKAKQEEALVLKVLLIDGQNNHKVWPESTPVIKQILQNSGRFEVTVSRTPPGDGRKTNYNAAQPTVADMPENLQAKWFDWRPDFSQYDVVVSNYNGVLWPEEVCLDFVDFVQSGGGFVSIHAADNAFSQWEEYQKMIGVGGWYGRSTGKHGPKVVWENNQLALDHSEGKCGAHGARNPVLVENRNQNHPITKGLPDKWLHPTDEVYYNMCGPAQGITVLASAHSDANTKGSGKDHPILLTLDYGKGRIFHNMLGHGIEAYAGAGFQHLLMRGTEWAATGKVTFDTPPSSDFAADTAVTRTP
ncbi:MAG: ThuA domain-containing protein [Verrucomicrobia bacterium]|nr:ThuA domain-containing protein [Verrucomicrobiota bacterium]